MKVLLIYMPVHKSHDSVGMRIIPPSVLYYLGGILERDGFDVDIIDPHDVRRFMPIENCRSEFVISVTERIRNADIVCLSSNTHNWPTTKDMVAIVKEVDPSKKVILGGLHPTYFHEHIIRSTEADFIMRGEGEKALPELLRCLDENEDVSNIVGLTWRIGEQVYLADKIARVDKSEFITAPLPLYDLLPDNAYNIMPIHTSRGCRFACKFCSIPRKRDWVGLDYTWVVDRIEKIVGHYASKFNDKCIYITDDCFTADPQRATKLLNKMIDMNSEMSIILEARATDLFDENLLNTLKHKNIVRIAIGIECGYDEGLKKIKKGLTTDQILRTMDKLREFKLHDKLFLSFIIGFPWEGLDECSETIEFAVSLIKQYELDAVNLNWLTLLPSELWDERNIYGIRLEPSVFDDNYYFVSQKYFFETRPLLDSSSVLYLNKLISDYEDRGVYLHKA
ncbi:B12-binding domain-containing radical SAM protein [Candidatus Contubernalis alkaliaceticus]|uniref:B12-binding domain-containing radical SAM protein n=1 Tax=Candidatus Contubernalis alkaliaceticus TaxID=338645 RepID=UPI001F4C042C|nr:radical SAM protein [Candidatus Contubernalis alkalaceticus]UNC92832.1 radical SAM protein [Candidatus Contubernalis alkalaceticus]